MKMVYVIKDDRTNEIIAVYSALKRAREHVNKAEGSEWLIIEYHKVW